MINERNLNIILDIFKSGKQAQSIIFIGPKYTSKFSTAKEFAKALNCLTSEFNACNSCASCKKIDNLGHPDFYVYGNGYDHIKIAEIHDLQKFINLRPYEARKKVFVINNADNLTNDAANCLLKTLEEPNKDSFIILTTSKISKIFPTIISRCQKFYFGMPNRLLLKGILNNDLKLDKEFLQILTNFSEGRENFALELKEKNFPELKNKIIDLFFVRPGLEFKLGNFEEKEDFKLALAVVLSVFRDILFLKLDLPKDDLINIDKLSLLAGLKDNFEFNELFSAIDELLKIALYADQNINLKLAFDVLKLKISEKVFK